MWYGCVVACVAAFPPLLPWRPGASQAMTIVWKRLHFNVIYRTYLSDVTDETCLVPIAFVFLWDPTSSWLLFNELKNKALSLFVNRSAISWTLYRGKRQWKVYRVTASVIYRWPLYAGQLSSKYKGWFLGSCSVTVIHRVTAIYSPLYTGSTV